MTSEPGPTAPPSGADAGERAYRRRIHAWALYDWADHAYVTVTATSFFPPHFVAIAAPAFLAAGAIGAEATARARDTASNVYAVTVSAALLVVAIVAPLVGTIADLTGRRKRLLLTVTGAGAVVAAAMVAVTTGRWVLALALYFTSQVAVNVALGLNSSLLPHVARGDDLGRASSLGYALGYVGGGLLLAVATAVFLAADRIGIGRDVVVRAAFLAVGAWWLGFSLPLALVVPEPAALPLAHGGGRGVLRDALIRLRHTLADLRRYRQTFTMLVAFWLYMEGIGAIILLATAYGAALGLPTSALVATLLLTQFVAFPYALAFGRLPDPAFRWRGAVVAMVGWTAVTVPALGALANHRGGLGTGATIALLAADQALGAALAALLGRRLLGPLAARLDAKRAVMLGLAVYAIVPVWGFFLRTPAEFFMIGLLVGTVQGGTQALSRSIYAQLTPRAKSGEFFGIYALSEKFAGILAPLAYGVVGALTHDPRASILSIVAFFALGILVLSRVDVAAGARVAAADEAVIEATHAAD
ncbi:MAG TPA: MFS transporter [Thermoanaerobaculaceae bacterium]|nr:MFS transporter [Thermoanaerobaculaceae bacterium]